MNHYCYNFKIADLCIRIFSETAVEIEASFVGFAVETECFAEADYTVYVNLTSKLQFSEGVCVYDGLGMSIFKTQEGSYVRVLREMHGEHKQFAVSFSDWENRVIKVEILKERKKHAESILEIFKCIAWETILLHEKRVLLHASYIKSAYGGIAFSGPSGIGKTTQASLWCKCQSAQLINGDKVILHKKNECWNGYGSPYAGSSYCYVNDKCELKYLIFLKQGTVCRLRRLSLVECFKELYAGVTLNRWDAEYVRMMCELIEELVAEIPIYEFTCTPDEEAVNFLKKKLEGGGVCGLD